jgi:flagellar biosynthetic protein FliP
MTRLLLTAAVLLVLTASPVLAQAAAQAAAPPPTRLDVRVDGLGSVSAPMEVAVLLTLLTFLPAILVTMTSFTRIVIVFHFLRQALGTQEVPSNQILIGLSLFLTAFIMAPVGSAINDAAVQPAIAGRMSATDAVSKAMPPLRDFMLKQTRETDLSLFLELSKAPRPQTPSDLPMRVVIPAFITSEVKTGFQMGFFVFVPFLLIDLVVSTTLLSMGMMQLPPAMISLPFKLLLFVTVDGWSLVVSSLVRSFV